MKEVIKVLKDEIALASSVKADIHIPTSTPTVPATLSPFAIDLKINSCVNKRLVGSFTDFTSQVAQKMGLTLTRGPGTFAPTYENWTILSSPFVHKTARTQLERRTHGSGMEIDGIWKEEVAAKFIWYIKTHTPNEIELDITLRERL